MATFLPAQSGVTRILAASRAFCSVSRAFTVKSLVSSTKGAAVRRAKLFLPSPLLFTFRVYVPAGRPPAYRLSQVCSRFMLYLRSITVPFGPDSVNTVSNGSFFLYSSSPK